MPALPPPFSELEERFAPILFRCLEAVGSTKGALYFRRPDRGFARVCHYGWPRTTPPPEALEVEDPLLILVKRARRSFTVNKVGDYPEVEPFNLGAEDPRYFLSPIYVMGDWVALLVQRDRARQGLFDEDRDGPPTLEICNRVAAELKALRIYEPPSTGEMPVMAAPAAPPSEPTEEEDRTPPPAPPPSPEKLTGFKESGEFRALDSDAEPATLPGLPPARALSSPRRSGMFTPEQRGYFWEAAALLCRLSPFAAVVFWWESPEEARPLLCYSPAPLSENLQQQILAHATFHLPQVVEQDLRLLSRSGREGGTALDGAFATQENLSLGPRSQDLLMVFRLEYAPVHERELRALAPALGLLRQYLEEARIRERYHEAFLSFAHRILASAEGRVPGLRAHSLGCAHHARALALRLDLPGADAEALDIAAILHDVGGILLDPSLHQKGPFGPEDRERIKSHPAHAAGFLKDLRFPFDVLRLIEHHHEHWDGGAIPAVSRGRRSPWGAASWPWRTPTNP